MEDEKRLREDLKKQGYKPEWFRFHLLWYIFIIGGCIIIPIAGILFLLYLSLRNLLKKKTRFYYLSKKQLYIRDRRFKTGQRPEGYKLVRKYAEATAKPIIGERIVYISKGVIGIAITLQAAYFQYSTYIQYSDSDSTEIELKRGIVVAKKGLNMRDSPSEAAKIILSIPNIETVQLLEESVDKNWLKVRYNDKVGWVWSSYIKATE